MVHPLYFEKFRQPVGKMGEESQYHVFETFGVKRHTDDNALTKPISLKNDLGWGEVSTLQIIMKHADFWTAFPEPGVWLVSAEFQPGAIHQRIDLLYIRNDGSIYPCELKLGGEESDSHGQILRYISDLKRQPISRDWIIEKRRAYLTRKYESLKKKREDKARAKAEADGEEYVAVRDPAGTVEQQVKFDMVEFEARIENIAYESFRLAPKTGVIIDEEFKASTVQAIEDLNLDGYSITLLQLRALVRPEWERGSEQYKMRLEFNDVTPVTPS